MRGRVEAALEDEMLVATAAWLPLLYLRWLMVNHDLWDRPSSAPTPKPRRQFQPWTADEDALLDGEPDDRAAAELIGRTAQSIRWRRWARRNDALTV